MTTKTCKFCQENKPLESFVKDKRNFDGRGPTCRTCSCARNLAWAKANPEKNREMKQASKKRVYTIEKRRREYTQGDVARKKAVKKAWNDAHRIERRINSTTRKKHIKQATPSWVTKEEKRQMVLIYKMAKLMSDNSEENYHVDHEIPLCGKTVSGLHIPSNLRIIEASQNQTKNAKYDPLHDRPTANAPLAVNYPLRGATA